LGSAEEPVYYGVLREIIIAHKEQRVRARALVCYSRNKAKLDAEKRQKLLQQLLRRFEEVATKLNHRKYRRYAYTLEQIHLAQKKWAEVKELVDFSLEGEEGNLEFYYAINKERLATAQKLDGLYLLVTNRPLSANEMLSRFKRKDRIEKSFSVIKGPIRIHPLFVKKGERIEALVFVCMLALLVYCILEMCARRVQRRITGRRILEKFETLTAVYVQFKDKSWMRTVPPLNWEQLDFLRAIRFPEPISYLASGPAP